MIKKHLSLLLVSILVILIAISIALSAIMVLRPVSLFSTNTVNDTSKKITNVQNRLATPQEEVFKPTRYIHVGEDYFYMTTDQSVLNATNKLLHESIKELEKSETLSYSTYEQLIFKNSSSVLLFDGPITIGAMNGYFGNYASELEQELFDTIVIGQNNDVYLINSATKAVVKGQIPSEIVTNLAELYRTNSTQFEASNTYVTKQGLVFLQKQEIKAKKQTYIVEQPSSSFFIEQFYTNTTELRNRSDDTTVKYNDNVSQLEINKNTNILTYFRNRGSNENLSQTVDIQQSFAALRRLENWKFGISYAGYQSNTSIVSFYRYINNYPILDKNQEGIIHMVVTESGIEKVRLPISIAQTLLTNRDEEVTLTSGEEAVAVLLGKGIELASVEDIRIGYSWNISSENNKVVEYVPEWYVKINNKWYSLASVSSTAQQEEKPETELSKQESTNTEGDGNE